ncbi:SDR family oxidoreductase [Leucobacter luti]|uniref:Ribitol 2-dehydrogenase n=1 Tax=Leucobacter luti TaxID=340320 RepID=A0A4Q7U338_9MICO|nr:SDR family oxidoreductase [Leucobacter luti]MBL3699328.1 SDR family oxidoreductase [Leucobacter luti]RZT66838.1 ribitol 2-dehydrogenase [Leucobacter luti]
MENVAAKVALVTGASSGIGRAYARALAEAGASVVLVGRNAERLREVAAELPGEHLAVPADVAETGSAAEIVRRAVEHFGRIDIVLANAGLYLPGDFAEADLAAVRALLDVNVFGAMAVIREALPAMIAAGTGDIVVTSSVSGHQAIHWEPVYSASKHAMQSFTHGVRRQLVGTGVRIGAIAPGVVLNELWGIGEADETAAQIAAATGIDSSDVAEAVLFMLSRPRHVNIRDLVILPTSQEI